MPGKRLTTRGAFLGGAHRVRGAQKPDAVGDRGQLFRQRPPQQRVLLLLVQDARN